MDDKQKRQEIIKIASQRLQEQGWDNVSHFADKSGVPYSMEAVRRAFTDTGEKKVLSPATLAVVLRYLNFSLKEIKDILQTYTKDNEIWRLIGEDDSESLTKEEKALIAAYREITQDRKDMISKLADQMKLLSEIAGKDISRHTDLMSRSK